MAHQCSSCKHGLVLFLLVLFLQRPDTSVASAAGWQPMQCNATPSCSSFLYATTEGRNLSEIAAVFNATASTALHHRPIQRPSGAVDVLVAVPCACEVINDTMTALFHDAQYVVKPRDTPASVKGSIFSGLAMNFGDDVNTLVSGTIVTVHLPCGCSSDASKGVVVSYAVQEGESLPMIASLFNSTSQNILNLNPSLTNPDFVKPGLILFVPIEVEDSS